MGVPPATTCCGFTNAPPANEPFAEPPNRALCSRKLRAFPPPQIGYGEPGKFGKSLVVPNGGDGTPIAGLPVLHAHLATNAVAEPRGPCEESQVVAVPPPG